ncbi:hypothetical protein [Marinobacterium lacunae]|uniref:hypothetical protein n=1 Tax=Marinobacterium lacunae TaxID=1232683 RepID=UPI000690BE6F|nr:hypothetical protein [Marinobacterium lacunae]
MNNFKINTIKKILDNKCPVTIPRSGDKGKAVNCYSISLYSGDNPILLVNEIGEKGLIGAYFESNEFVYNATVPFSLMDGMTVRIDHYHRLTCHIYSGIYDYIIHEWTKFYILQELYYSLKNKVPQFFFNRKRIQFQTRMTILEKIITKQASAPHRTFGSLDLMTYLYGMRWYLHPKKREAREKLDLYLESFVASGELVKPVTLEYKITGKAIATLEQYQIEIAREKDNARTQKAIAILTFILALFSGVQSNIIETTYKFNLDPLIKFIISLFE